MVQFKDIWLNIKIF